jgi:hypothetical protein
MTLEEQKQFDNLLRRVKELEDKSIQINLKPEDKENIKNNIFEGYLHSDKTATNNDADTPYLKLIWKGKVIYIPFYI